MSTRLGGLAIATGLLAGCATMTPQSAATYSDYELCWIVQTGQSVDGWASFDSQSRHAAGTEIYRRGVNCGQFQQQFADVRAARAAQNNAMAEAGAKLLEMSQPRVLAAPAPEPKKRYVCRTLSNGITHCNEQ